MATGVTKQDWNTETNIISDESFSGDHSYQLTYPDMIPEEEVLSAPSLQCYRSIFGQSQKNKLYFGDNLDVLRKLIRDDELQGKVKLIYIDPPYSTNRIFKGRNQKCSYRDDLQGSHFIEFMRRRLILLKQLLSEDGSIYIHLDSNMVFAIKVIMDGLFGDQNFRGLITRKKCSNKNHTKSTYGNISDYILYYSKSEVCYWRRATVPWTNEKIKKEYPCLDEATGKLYKKVPIHAPGVRNGETGKEWRGMMPPPGKHWQYTPKRLDELDSNNEIYWSANGNPRRKVFFDPDKGIPVQDIWLDVQDSLNQNIKITGYPTEKNPQLLTRIIEASSQPGDYVLDCFAGSGTTLGVAEQLGRRWIGVDNSSEAIFHIFKRFFLGLQEMGDFVSSKGVEQNSVRQMALFEEKVEGGVKDAKSANFEFITDARFSELAIALSQPHVDKLTTEDQP